jgi:uracil-DNA glycosylase
MESHGSEMTSPWIEKGNPSSPIWMIGEAPGEYEIARQIPFTGPSGTVLDAMSREAGIDPTDVFYTNVCHVRPPSYRNKVGKVIHNDINQFFLNRTEARRLGIHDHHGAFPAEPIQTGLAHLEALYQSHHPNLTIALGNTPMWALVGESGITKWRGSILHSDQCGKIIPTFHPADVLPGRSPHHRPIVVQDLRRCAREAKFRDIRTPEWHFTIRPTLEAAQDWLATHARPGAPLVADIETMGGYIDCIGFASSKHDAISIPFFLSDGTPIWSPDEETHLILQIRDIMQSSDMIFHNAIYDCQVIAARWGFMPRLTHDTMAMQHVAFPGLLGGKIDPISGRVAKGGSSLSLSFISSMYCEFYRYWKDDGKLWDPSIHSPNQRWTYNCEDCVRTFECYEELWNVLAALGLTEQYLFEMQLFAPAFDMMFRGIRFDAARARQIRAEFDDGKLAILSWLRESLGHDFNPLSSAQCKALFYDDLALPLQRHRKTGSPTLDDGTLEIIGRQNPLLLPLIRNIQNYRTLDTVKDDVDVDMLSSDGRLRCDINVAYVETMRFSTNTNAFGEGRNLQNFKKPEED